MTKIRKTPPGTVAVAVAAKFFGVSDKHIYNLLASGDIPLIRWKKRRLLSGEWFADMKKVWKTLNITHSPAYELTRQALLFRSQNGTTEQPAQLELPKEEGPRKISKEEIPAFRCSYQEFFDCTAEGSEYDVNLDRDRREKGPWAGMVTVKCKNMCATEVNGEIFDWWCNREGLAEPFEKLHNLTDPREEERLMLQAQAREELAKARAKVADLERELGNG
tara:strand:+ start:3090 stop:3749 length:660 start_codon:yes stop_codon:yes gene_type:complete